MTLQEIMEIKNLAKDLKINKFGTSMFLDGKWGVRFDYEILTTFETFRIVDYCKEHGLVISIAKVGIRIQ